MAVAAGNRGLSKTYNLAEFEENYTKESNRIDDTYCFTCVLTSDFKTLTIKLHTEITVKHFKIRLF